LRCDELQPTATVESKGSNARHAFRDSNGFKHKAIREIPISNTRDIIRDCDSSKREAPLEENNDYC
jgi:hypothetical protein